MGKQEFLENLRKGLSGLPQEDIEERLSFYGEMIDDRMEEGVSEEEAVAAVGTVEEIVAQTVADIPLAKLAKERIKPKRRLRAGEILLLVLGSPLWIALGIAAAAVIASLYIVLWAVVVSLWAVFGSLAGCAVGGLLAGGVFTTGAHDASAVAMLASGLICSGLAIFMFYGAKAATKGAAVLTRKLALRIKNGFIRKETA